MSIRFIPLERERLPDLISFLCEIQNKQPSDPTLDPAFLDWKYYKTLENWNGSRSYILEKDGLIAAHAGVCPVEFATPTGIVTSMQIVDWAASRSVPGAGVGVMRDAMRLTQTFLAIGGSEDTRKLIPKTPGFREIEPNWIWSRSVRPFRQFTRSVRKDARSLARMGRNLLQTLSSSLAPVRDWTAAPLPTLDPPVIATTKQAFSPLVRRASMIDYLRQRPGGSLRAYSLKNSGQNAGFFLLDWFGAQCRITDLWIDTEHPDGYASAYSTALQTAAADPGSCEIAACCSTAIVQNALASNGLRRRWANPVYLQDRKNLFAAAPPPEINGMIGDLLYFYHPSHPFYC